MGAREIGVVVVRCRFAGKEAREKMGGDNGGTRAAQRKGKEGKGG